MSSTKLNLVAVLPDGREHAREVSCFNRGGFTSLEYRSFCEEALRKLSVVTPRSNPVNTIVGLYALSIKGTVLERRHIGNYEVRPSLTRLTEEEYSKELSELLEDIPKEFHGFVGKESWDRGHSAGYEEVINIANELVYNLKPAIEAYAETLKHQITQTP